MKKKRNGKNKFAGIKIKMCKANREFAELRLKYGCKMNEMDV